MRKVPNWLDRLIYNLFWWRWHPILSERPDLLAVFETSIKTYKADAAREKKPGWACGHCGAPFGFIVELQGAAVDGEWWCVACLGAEVRRLQKELLGSQRYNDIFFEQFYLGEKGAMQGLDRDENPQEPDTLPHEAWDAGWLANWAAKHIDDYNQIRAALVKYAYDLDRRCVKVNSGGGAVLYCEVCHAAANRLHGGISHADDCPVRLALEARKQEDADVL